jgi:hypothetical protein
LVIILRKKGESMLSGINNIYSCSKRLPLFEKRRDFFLLGADALLVVALVVISGLTLGNVVHFLGSTVMNHQLAYGLGGGAIALMLFGVATSLMRRAKLTPLATTPTSINIFEDVAAEIAQARDFAPEFSQIRASKTVSSHKIYKGLSLGMASAFAQSTHLVLYSHETGKLVPIATHNPEEFDVVITVCPLSDLASDFDKLSQCSEADIRQSFTDHQVDWHYIGRASGDDKLFWYGLIHDCTFPTSELAVQHEIGTVGVPTEKFQSMLTKKQSVVTATPVAEWFEPVFKEIDRAVMGNENVLVHCYAGQSRSATLLAAYFINRFGVAAMDAALFLRSKRHCVSPKFIEELEDYAAALKVARAG